MSIASQLTPTTQQLQLACKFFSQTDIEFCLSMTTAGGNVISNGFTTIPSEIGFLTQLTTLKISFNMLTGTLPSVIGYLTNLQEFYLERNKFTGTIPSTLGNLVQLTHLQMDNNLFTGTIPSSFGNLVQLTSLYLMWIPELRGTIPSTLCESSPAGHDNLVFIDCKNIECSCCRSFGVAERCCSWCFWWKIERAFEKRLPIHIYAR